MPKNIRFALWIFAALILLGFSGTLFTVKQGGTGVSSFTAHGVIVGNGSSALSVTAAGTAGQILQSGGSSDPTWASAPLGVYGDGSDAGLTYDGSTTILGMAPAANVYTITRDIFASSVTVNNGVTLKMSGCRLYCTGTITNNGTIQNNGSDASNATAGAATSSANALGVGSAGGAGGNSGAGSTGQNSTVCVGGAGGAGGISGAGQGGGAAGTVTAPSAIFGGVRNLSVGMSGLFGTSAIKAGTGGGGGGGSGANNGGGGGGGGGAILIAAWKIDNTSGTISANGGQGGNGTGANGGSGGGGGGGVVWLVYHSYAGTAATATKGAAGVNVTGTGQTGSQGSDGIVVTIQN